MAKDRSRVCPNALTVKVGTVEHRLTAAIQGKILKPEAVNYLVTAVNHHLDGFAALQHEQRRHLEAELHQVEEELANVQKAILAGVVGETTAVLVKDREARRRDLEQRLRALEVRAKGPLQIDADAIRERLEDLQNPLREEPSRVNTFFREHLEPIVCTPVAEGERRFYRARGEGNATRMLESLGLAQAFDFGGCGGWI